MGNQAHIRDSRQPGHFWADNEIVDEYLPIIGIYGFAVYMLLTKHADSKTGQCDPSVSGLAAKLGISAPTVRAALDKLKDAGLITIKHRRREKDGKLINQTSIYTILAIKKAQNDVPTKPGLVPNEIYQGTKGDLPGVLNQVDQGTKPGLVGVLNQVSSNKTHKNKTQLTRGGDEETQIQSPPRPLSELATAIADVCKINPKIATAKQKTALNATYQALNSIGATPSDVRQRESWWYANAWQAKKEGRAPRPDELQTIWEEAAAPVRNHLANGTRPPADLPMMTAADSAGKAILSAAERKRIVEANWPVGKKS